MRWTLLAVAVLLAALGVVVLLYAYRVLGKAPGADKEYDATMARLTPTYKVAGWCMVGMAVLGLISYITDSLWQT
jgi:hypothetical protein